MSEIQKYPIVKEEEREEEKEGGRKREKEERKQLGGLVGIIICVCSFQRFRTSGTT